MWLTQASIWVGFGLVILQSVVEIVKIWTIGIAPGSEAEMIRESV
jgi:TRAP-type mannitol/chloroaromatic compound transport system permease small subunit